MKTIQVVQTTALSKVNGNAVLREGSSVFVRVIKNNGNNSYIMAFSGGRFAIKSEVALKEGAGFLAKIKLADGKILLQKMNPSVPDKSGVQKLNPQQQKLFFQNLGLIPDNISYSLFQQMKQLGVRFEQRLFGKARSISKNFKGKEIEAAETVLILEEKGIEASKEAVESVIGGNEDFMRKESSEDFSDAVSSENPFKKFFSTVLSSEADFSNPCGVLALFNHMGFNFEKPETKGSWIKIPFVFSVEPLEGTGRFCAFLNNFTKKMESAFIGFIIEDIRYDFSIAFKSGKLSGIRAGCSQPSRIEEILCLLENRFKDIPLGVLEGEGSCFRGEGFPVEIFWGSA